VGFTLKSSYALRGIFIIAQKMKDEKKNAIPISDIVKGTDIPKDFLEKIFGELKHKNIIKSIRGRYGGYALSKEPKDIKIKDIVLTLDNPLGSFKCIGSKKDCEYTSTCAVKYVWYKVHNAMFKELEDMTIENLLNLNIPEENFDLSKLKIETEI
jgi:Rrf2 family iron-sulfur cluster assembly transcriptional regulator